MPCRQVGLRAKASRVERALHPERRPGADPIEDALHDRVEQPTDPAERERCVVVDGRAAFLGGFDRDRVLRDESRALCDEYDASWCLVFDDLVAERHVTPAEACNELERGADPDQRLANRPGLAQTVRKRARSRSRPCRRMLRVAGARIRSW